jgi:glycosyltransferase involved in cell wall biosynthesis
MHVWQVNPYGALPGESWREFRTVLAARALVQAGHTVTWWVANFEHRSKAFRTAGWERRPLFAGFDAEIVPTSAYQRHISMKRIAFERTFALRIREHANRAARPDVIVLTEPALFTAAPIVALAEDWSVPIVLDIGDLWPELFQLALPRSARRLAPALFAPLYWRRARLARRASGYISVTRDYLALLQSIAPRSAAAVAYWGVDVSGIRAELVAPTPLPPMAARAKRPGEVWAVYAGTLGPNYDIRTILGAAERLRSAGVDITIFIAGDGVSRGEVEAAIRDRSLTNCHFLGPLPAATVTKLYSVCDVALSTYVRESTVSMPIKAFDYFAAGLPVVNSLGRDLGALVTSRAVGLQYEAENPEALASALRVLAADVEGRARMAANAARLGEEFDWRVQYREYVHVVEAVHAAEAGRVARAS